jgi:hypothetical protein
MWSAIRWLVLRIVAARWLFKLSGLGLLVPIALLLKAIGLPVLAVLSVLAFPILILLFLFGLPIFLVLAVGGLFMGMLAMVLMIGIAAIKIGLFIVLPIWLIWKVGSKLFGWAFRRGNGGSGPTTSSTSTDSSTGPTTSDPLNGADPA